MKSTPAPGCVNISGPGTTPQPIGEAILTSLFPDGDDGRIPLIAVTGTSGKTTTTRLIAHLFAETGQVVGMSTTDGIYVADRRIATGDCSGPQSAHGPPEPGGGGCGPRNGSRGILREGLAFDRSHVTVVTNLGEETISNSAGSTPSRNWARVKRTTVEAVAADGAAVLKADDPLVAAMADHCAGEVIWFACDAEHPVIVRHREAGGRAVLVRDGVIVFAWGAEEERLASLADVPITHQGRVGFQVENVLATAGAAWALGMPHDAIRSGLASFLGDPTQMPARFNLFEVKGATVVVDFPHNAMGAGSLDSDCRVDAPDAPGSRIRRLQPPRSGRRSPGRSHRRWVRPGHPLRGSGKPGPARRRAQRFTQARISRPPSAQGTGRSPR